MNLLLQRIERTPLMQKWHEYMINVQWNEAAGYSLLIPRNQQHADQVTQQRVRVSSLGQLQLLTNLTHLGLIADNSSLASGWYTVRGYLWEAMINKQIPNLQIPSPLDVPGIPIKGNPDFYSPKHNVVIDAKAIGSTTISDLVYALKKRTIHPYFVQLSCYAKALAGDEAALFVLNPSTGEVGVIGLTFSQIEFYWGVGVESWKKAEAATNLTKAVDGCYIPYYWRTDACKTRTSLSQKLDPLSDFIYPVETMAGESNEVYPYEKIIKRMETHLLTNTYLNNNG